MSVGGEYVYNLYVKQDLSQGQDSSPDSALPITLKTLCKNFNILLTPTAVQ